MTESEKTDETLRAIVDKLDEFSMLDSDTPGAVSEEEKAFCREKIRPLVEAAITAAVEGAIDTVAAENRRLVANNLTLRTRQAEMLKEATGEHNDIVRQVKSLEAEVKRLTAELAAVQLRFVAEKERADMHEQATAVLERVRTNLVAELAAVKVRTEPQVGSWTWALEQMKAGTRVTNGYLRQPLINRAIELQGPTFWLCGEGPTVRVNFDRIDFERMDWQVVPAPPTRED